MTSAHGQDITRKVRARYIQTEKEVPGITRGGITAINMATTTTTGV